MSLDVFISYSSKDKLTADAVCGTLEARGIRCWIAPRDITPGQDWTDAIIDGISAARVFVLLLSSSSNTSEQVKREVQNAVSEGLPIVPFRLEDVALSKHMRYFIGTPHWLDALTPPMEAHLERLSKTVHALLQTTEQDEVDSVLLLEEGLDVPQIVSSPTPRVVQPPVTAPAPQAKATWNPDLLRRIERELALYMGPMARMVVHQAATKTFDPSSLCQIVSRSVPREDDRVQFLSSTSRLLGPSKAPSSAEAPLDMASRLLGSETPSAPVEKVWDEPTLQKIERQFAAHIGPLARILVKRAAKKANSVDEIYSLLAENLTDPSTKANFLQEKRG